MEEGIRFAGRSLKLWGGYLEGWNHAGDSNRTEKLIRGSLFKALDPNGIIKVSRIEQGTLDSLVVI
jgi:hypothetical protein